MGISPSVCFLGAHVRDYSNYKLIYYLTETMRSITQMVLPFILQVYLKVRDNKSCLEMKR